MDPQNDVDLNVDIVEVRKVLEDANMNEPNMTKELMMSYYRALKNSKSTASEEDETRRLSQSQEELSESPQEDTTNIENTPLQKEKPFTAKVWSSEKKLSVESALERNNNDNLLEDDILEEIVNDSLKDATKTTFGFNEMIKDSEHTLSIITHKLKFIPIQSSDKFLTAGTALKARLLYAYHTKVNKMKTELARLSFYPAPLPKITSMTETFPSFSGGDLPETYICRSGRQTKRKIYNYDDDDSLDGISNKKVKNSEEQEWLTKPTQNKTSVRTHKKQETSKPVNELNKTEPEIDDTNKEKKAVPKKEIRTPLSRKLTNAEIVRRSSIFSDSPKRRCESMFDKLKEEEMKKEKEERSMELFHKTLERLDDENNEAACNEDIITVDDEEQVKIRVVPPNPGRKIINRKRNNPEGLAPLDVKISSPSQKKEIPMEQNGSSREKEEFVSKSAIKKRPAIRKTSAVESTDSVPSTSRTSKTSVTCPICNRCFEEDKIEEHAATCGDDPVPRPNSKLLRITCEICDKVVDFDTNYEVHVKECILKSKEKD